MSHKIPTIPHPTDEDERIPLPFRFEICSQCDGHGRSSAYLGAFTATEFDDLGHDFQNEYMAGTYDRTCEDCDGTGKVRVPDYSRMTNDQVQAWNDEQSFEAEYQAEREAEIRMGC